jgi:hypothetical protein
MPVANTLGYYGRKKFNSTGSRGTFLEKVPKRFSQLVSVKVLQI